MFDIGDKVRIHIEQPKTQLQRTVDGLSGTVINVTVDGYEIKLPRSVIVVVKEHEVVGEDE